MTPESKRYWTLPKLRMWFSPFGGGKYHNLLFLFESTMPSVQCLLTHIDCREAEAQKCHPLSSFITAVSNSRSALLTVSHSRRGWLSIHVRPFRSHASKEIVKVITRMILFSQLFKHKLSRSEWPQQIKIIFSTLDTKILVYMNFYKVLKIRI